MTSNDSKTDGIDSYNESVWRNLGHPAFEPDINYINEDIEWWDIDEGTNTSNEKH